MGHSVTPGYPSDALKTFDMEGLKHPKMATVQDPCLTAVEENCDDNCQVDRYFGVEVFILKDPSSSLPNEDACLIQS